ncbi:MAG: hypothetical protein PHX69_00910 [Simplicispira sp.]|uniref:hypothetical protein n=1 Tax=Simplicispira sp. TaxID=2015802 RepID=UPI002582B1FD|nr:hypothetical protein [Simplicispira sp.]MDD2690326.1 hypothetical protein [Simplicispira sp.]
MSNQVTWFKDEATWKKYKDICEDKNHFGPSYNEWVAAVNRKIAELATQGVLLQKVETNPEDYLNWCKSAGHSMNAKSRSLYLAHIFSKK